MDLLKVYKPKNLCHNLLVSGIFMYLNRNDLKIKGDQLWDLIFLVC